ncbi:MAG: SDR family oxidoreductase, partial [Acidimicrobiaceae bacterium]|nr:SDR family oxidoreductase [Acidimicrobiaceae bacterium]
MAPISSENKGGVALVTGASRGLGEALSRGLVKAGWTVIVDARDASALNRAADALRTASPRGAAVAVPGDVANPAHRRALVEAAERAGGLDLLVNNASSLGPSPLPALTELAPEDLETLVRTNAVAPLALVQDMAHLLHRSSHPRVVNVTSDASVEAYPGWGGYGASKAALDQLSNVLATEEPGWRVWWVDPGDLRTKMHQDAFPGEDISDRPEPESVVPALLALIRSDRPSGRVRLSEIHVSEPVE